MTKTETLRLLAEWQAHHDALQKLTDGIQSSLGLDPNAPFFDTMWKIFDAYTKTLAVQVGDACGWLMWFYGENDMGTGGGQAGYDGKTTQIKSLGALFGLIAESRKRAAS